MLLNNPTMPIPPIEGVVYTKVIDALSAFFECHTLDEAKKQLADLHHAWGSGYRLLKGHMVIANMVFFVTNVNILVRRVAAFDCVISPIDELTDKRLFVLEFFNSFDISYAENLLNYALQRWICPDIDTKWSDREINDSRQVFNDLSEFLQVCNEVLEGGMVCA